MAEKKRNNPLTERLEAALSEAMRHPEPQREKEPPAPPRISTSTTLPRIDAPLITKDEPSDSARGITMPDVVGEPTVAMSRADLEAATRASRSAAPGARAAASVPDDLVLTAPIVVPPEPEVSLTAPAAATGSLRDRVRRRPAAEPAAAVAPKAAAAPASSGAKRQARVRIRSIDPWSVMKTAFLLSIALAIVGTSAVAIIWSMLGVTGIWDAINESVRTVLDGESASTFDIRDYVGTARIVGLTALVSVLNVFLLTALATLGAFLYNMASSLLGGIETILSEDR